MDCGNHNSSCFNHLVLLWHSHSAQIAVISRVSVLFAGPTRKKPFLRHFTLSPLLKNTRLKVSSVDWSDPVLISCNIRRKLKAPKLPTPTVDISSFSLYLISLNQVFCRCYNPPKKVLGLYPHSFPDSCSLGAGSVV